MTQKFHSQLYTPKNWKELFKKNLYTNVHNSTIHNCQKVEKTQMSINKCMDKQNMVYPYNGIVFSHKKEWSSETYYNIDEPWKHVKGKKPDTKGTYRMILFIWTIQKG